MPNHREAGRPLTVTTPENVEGILDCAGANSQAGFRKMKDQLKTKIICSQKDIKSTEVTRLSLGRGEKFASWGQR